MGTDSRERMVRSAAYLFRERGYSGTGFRDVIAHSGAPRGSIYHHFPDGKAQLAEEAVRRNLQKSVESNPAWNGLTAVAEGRYILLPGHKFLYKPNAAWADSYEYLAKMLGGAHK